MRLFLQILLFIGFWLPQLSIAAIYKYEASGVVDYVSNGGTQIDGQVVAGDTVLLRFTLDTDESMVPEGTDSTQTTYRQSYPLTVEFNGESGPLLALIPKSDYPWYGAAHHRVMSGDLREHRSGNNSDGMTFYIDGSPTTDDFVDLVFNFSESSPPYAFTDMALRVLPSFEEFNQTGFFIDFSVWADPMKQTIIAGYFESLSVVPRLSCNGFHEPMDQYPVKVKKNRVLPLKMKLFNGGGQVVTDLDLVSSPILRITHSADALVTPVDVSEDTLPVGLGTDGNEFVFTDEGYWQFNLMTRNYSAPGTYTIEAMSGDEWQYVVDPHCVTTFTID